MMFKKNPWFRAMGVLLVLCGSAEAQPPKTTESAALPDYRIGAEDILEISVFGNEALTRTVPVRPDGMISLPLLNDVKAIGLTPMELRALLMKKLVVFVPTPEVAVIVTEVRSLMISVIGQVMKPGRYDLKNAATIVEALAQAGGFKEFASRSHVIVLRTEGAGAKRAKRIPFDYDKLGDLKRPQENFALLSGDIVMVP